MDPVSPTPLQPVEPTQPVVPTPEPAPVVSAPEVVSTQPAAAAPVSFNQPSGVAPGSEANDPAPSKSRNKLKLLMMAAIALVVLGGGSALAYFTVIVPSKPENVIKSALKNTAEANEISATITAEGKSADSPAFKLVATSKTNRSAKTSGVDMKATMTGVSVSAEMRFVDDSAYIMVGDLSNAEEAIKAFSPEAGAIVSTLKSKVTNQWFEIDSTLLDETGTGCVVDGSLKFEQADYDLMDKLYKQNKFMTIDKSSSDNVNGQAATKYDLTIDNKTSESFLNGLEELPMFKKLDGCGQTDEKSSSPADQVIKKVETSNASGTTPISIWVDKASKRVSKLMIESTDQDKKDGVTGKLEVTMDYKPVTVTKPTDSKPITTLLGELTGLFQGAAGTDSLGN